MPNEEQSCHALLDTEKMSKAEYENIAKLRSLYFFGPQSPLGFVDSAKGLAEAKKESAALLLEVEKTANQINSLKKPRWKKLGAFLVAQAQANHERESAMIAFMENWNPEPLLVRRQISFSRSRAEDFRSDRGARRKLTEVS